MAVVWARLWENVHVLQLVGVQNCVCRDDNLAIATKFQMSNFGTEFLLLEIHPTSILYNKESKKLLIIWWTIIFMKILYYTVNCKLYPNFRDVNIGKVPLELKQYCICVHAVWYAYKIRGRRAKPKCPSLCSWLNYNIITKWNKMQL